MTYRSSRSWEPTPPFKAFLAVVAVALILFLLSGCSFLEKLTAPPSPDPRTVLPRGQVLEVTTHGRLVKARHLSIENFRCQTPPMVCVSHGVTKDCHCP